MPEALTKQYAKIDPEFILEIQPARHLNTPYAFNEEKAIFTSIADKRKYKVINKEKAKYITANQDQIKCAHEVKIKKLVKHARIPKWATSGSIGFDIAAAHTVILKPNQITKVHTGLAMAIPSGMYLRLAPRSGLAAKGISVEAGVIDNDYRGEVCILLRNHTKSEITIREGQRAAQCIFEEAHIPCITVTSNLPNTSRGTKGFGSTSQTYHKENREAAITSVLRVAFESEAMKQAKTLSKEEGDQYAEMMMLQHKPLPPKESNKHSKLTSNAKEAMNTESTIPTLPQDRVNSSLPSHMTLSRDFILQATGYHKSEVILKHLHTVANGSVSVSTIDQNPEKCDGEMATLKSSRRNTQLSNTNNLQPSKVYNMDIAYGPTVAIGGIRYALVLIDRKTKRKFIYRPKNLKSSIQNALNQFLVDAGAKPRLIRSDFNQRLIGGQTRKLLVKKGIKVEAAPPRRQHQNGLIERHWQNIVTMSRN